jgi:hypothetical protein
VVLLILASGLDLWRRRRRGPMEFDELPHDVTQSLSLSG